MMSYDHDSLRGLLTSCLTKADLLKLDLSADDGDYDLSYISRKLASCSAFVEQLSSISFELTKYALEIAKQVHSWKGLVSLKERSFKEGDLYQDSPREKKTLLLERFMESDQKELDEWVLNQLFLKEIRLSIAERIQSLKRLDSDLRLQQKLLEVRVSSGVGSDLNRSLLGVGLGYSKSSSDIEEMDIT